VLAQQVDRVSLMVETKIHETNYPDRQSNVQAQHGGREAAGAEHIGNTNQKY